MKHLSRFAIALLVLLGTTFVQAAPTTQSAEAVIHQPAQAADFLRYVDRGNAGGRLETADVAFRDDQGVTVHLVAAVHIGERDYFEGLNQSFKLRDAVLYEMVKDKEQPLPTPGGLNPSHSAVSEFQRFLKDSLNLEFQLDHIDYSRPNFIHADLDAQTFQRMQDERGESMLTIMLGQMWEQMNKPQPQMSDQDAEQQLEQLVRVFTRPDSERRMKIMLAKQMVSMESEGQGFGAMNGTVLLTERNKAAITTLKKTLQDRSMRDIAIFYGAAHMPELSARLEEMGFHPVSREWRMAWDLTLRGDEPSAVENLLIDLVRTLNDASE
jgi:hypothetical protein